jgi:O-6-methylguanine DNA methyltransferase
MIGTTKTRLAERLEDRFPKIDLRRDDKAIAKAMTRIVTFIEKPAPTPPDISLDIRGTPFQRRVWQEAAKIRLGETSTYSAIAEAIGSPKSMRAVGSACTNNLFAIIIPCHRVLHKGDDAMGRASSRQNRYLKRERALTRG